MALTDNPRIIHAPMNGRRFAVTSPITQYDYGYLLLPEGVELPTVYEIDFSNEEKRGTSLTVYGGAEGAEVPEELIRTGKDVYAFYYRVGEGYGKTEFTWRLPNKCRPSRDGETPTPTQQSSIDQLIVRSNEAVESAEQSAEQAEQAKNTTEAYVNTAHGYAEQASASATASANSALASAQRASASEQSASASANSALASAQSASQAQGYAQTASAKADSITGLTATAQTLPDGSSATASYDAQTGVMSFGIPKGKDGTNGIDGDDGYSPTANVSKSGKVATITITDKNGTTSAQVSDGEDGATGATPNLTIGTVETLEPNESATASITGTPENPVLNLGIPQGEQGEVTLEDYYKAFPTDTSSGAIASFSDGADDLPLKSLVVNIDPAQDLHGYDSPWVGGAGVNKWDEQWEVGAIAYATGDNAVAENKIRSKNYIPVVSGETYRIVTSNNLQIFYYDSSKAFVSYEPNSKANNATITIPEGCAYLRFFTYGANYGEVYKDDIAINYPSTITTYSPYENLCPISGWTGANLYMTGANLAIKNATYCGKFKIGADGRIQSSVYPTWCLPVPRGTIACSKVVTGVTGKINYLALTDEIPQAGTSYYDINGDAGGNVVSFTNYATRTVNNSANHKYLVLMGGTGDDDFETAVKRNVLMVSFGEDKPYVDPIDGTTIPISWQTEAGTVYGGSLDVLSGVLTNDLIIVDLETVVNHVQVFSETKSLWFSDSLSSLGIAEIASADSAFIGYCDTYPIRSYVNCLATQYSLSIRSDGNRKAIYVHTDGTSDIKPSGYAVLKRATPITYQLTPHEVNSLLEVNNIFANTGDSEVEYRADTKLYIERLTAPDSADMIADANITSGQYFMVGNSLYKATANIANGSAIVVGTNCTRKSLSEALNEINA